MHSAEVALAIYSVDIFRSILSRLADASYRANGFAVGRRSNQAELRPHEFSKLESSSPERVRRFLTGRGEGLSYDPVYHNELI